ncbi:MAG: glycosyltransferase family 4 protein [Bacillota bacterium]
MKISIIGEFNKSLDEGMRNVTFNIHKELIKNHDVLSLDLKKISIMWFIRLLSFKPQIIHYTHGPTVFSIILLYIISKITGSKSVVSTTQPHLSPVLKVVLFVFRPDLVLAQSDRASTFFESAGCKTVFLPNGIDTNRFVNISDSEKRSLRKKYGINEDIFIILHVGPIKRERNLKVFCEIQSKCKVQVIIIGSTSFGVDKDVYNSLIESGCIVWVKYFRNIEEIYQMADCYVFPVFKEFSCIDMPLSVLEAMACNIGVITSKYQALPKVIKESEGVIFIDRHSNIINIVNSNLASFKKSKNRNKVLSYSWENITKKLEIYYREIIN